MPVSPNDPLPTRMIETRAGVERLRRVEQDHLGPATGIRDYDCLTTIRIRQPRFRTEHLFGVLHAWFSRRPLVKDVDDREGEKV